VRGQLVRGTVIAGLPDFNWMDVHAERRNSGTDCFDVTSRNW